MPWAEFRSRASFLREVLRGRQSSKIAIPRERRYNCDIAVRDRCHLPTRRRRCTGCSSRVCFWQYCSPREPLSPSPPITSPTRISLLCPSLWKQFGRRRHSKRIGIRQSRQRFRRESMDWRVECRTGIGLEEASHESRGRDSAEVVTAATIGCGRPNAAKLDSTIAVLSTSLAAGEFHASHLVRYFIVAVVGCNGFVVACR